MRTPKKLLSVLIAVIMILSLIPATVLADEPDETDVPRTEVTESGQPGEEDGETPPDGTDTPSVPEDSEETEEPEEPTLQDRIDALPEVDDVRELMETAPDQVDSIYAEVSTLAKAVEELDEAGLAELNTAKLDALVELFTPEAETLEETVPTTIEVKWIEGDDGSGTQTAEALRQALADSKESHGTVDLYIGEGRTLEYKPAGEANSTTYVMTVAPGVTLNVKSGTLKMTNRVNISGTLNIENGALVTVTDYQFNIFSPGSQYAAYPDAPTAEVHVKSGGKLEVLKEKAITVPLQTKPGGSFNEGILNIDQGGEVTAYSLSIRGDAKSNTTHLNVAGTLTVLGSNPTFYQYSNVTVSGTFVCNTASSAVVQNQGNLTVAAGGKLVAKALKNSSTASAVVEENGEVTVDNGVTNSGTITNSGKIGAGYMETGTDTNSIGDVVNNGTITLTSSKFRSEFGLTQNSGRFTNNGTLSIEKSVTIGSNGVVDNTAAGEMTVTGTIKNAGVVTFPAGFAATDGSTNTGTVFVLGENPTYPFGEDAEFEALVTNQGRTGFSMAVASALTGADNGDIVRLQKDCTVSSITTLGGKATLDLNGKTLTMNSNLKIKTGGDLTVTDSAGSGCVKGYFAELVGSSSTQTGAAVLTIEKGTFTGIDGKALPNFNVVLAAYTGDGAVLNVKGGDFTAAKGIVSYGYDSQINITGGVFRNQDDESFSNYPIYNNGATSAEINLPAGMQLVRTAKGDYYEFTLAPSGNVASVNGAEYPTLQAAFDAAASGSTVQLLRDYISTDITFVPVGKTVTLDMNGHSYDGLGINTIAPLANSTLTVKDSSGEAAPLAGVYPIRAGQCLNGTENANGVTIVLDNGANIVAKAMKLSYSWDARSAVETWNKAENATVTIKEGAKITGTRSAVELGCKNSTINMEGGEAVTVGTWGALTVGGSDSAINITGGTVTAQEYAIVNGYGSVINIKDGTVTGEIYLTRDDSTLTIDGGEFITRKDGGSNKCLINAGDNSTITINGGTFTALENKSSVNTLIEFGENDTVVVNGGTFISENCSIFDIGITADQGDLTINGGDFTAINAEVFELNVSGGDSAKITIQDGTFTGVYENTAEEGEEPSAHKDSIFYLGFYHGNRDGKTDITISGGEFQVSEGQQIYLAENSKYSSCVAENSITNITGGVFHDALYDTGVEKKPTVSIEKGVFQSIPDNTLADGKTATNITLDNDPYQSVGNATAGVAQVGEDAFYTTVEGAVTAANEADESASKTVTLLDDAEVTEDMTIGEGVKLIIPEDTVLTIEDGVSVENKGTVESAGMIDNAGETKIEVTLPESGKTVVVPAGAVMDDEGNVVSGTANDRPVINPDGSVTIPNGGSVTNPDGTVIPLPNGGKLDGGEIKENPAPSSGGGSSSGYSVTVDKAKNGSVTVSPKSASKGTTVTITVKPDAGYELDDLTVTDKNGDSVKLTKKSDTKYTFIMPAGKVTVEATFVKVEEASHSFTDVPNGYWAEDEIAWAYENGYMNGNTAVTFNPNGTVTRQQLWMILARLSGQRPADFAEARAWAMDNAISDGTNPGGAVTRQQMVAILYRYAQLMGYGTSGSAALTAFPDNGSVAAYAKDAMSWSVANGIVGGTTAGTLNPAGTATRAQFAVILYRFCDKVTK